MRYQIHHEQIEKYKAVMSHILIQYYFMLNMTEEIYVLWISCYYIFFFTLRKVSKLCTERPNECYFAKGGILTVDLRQNRIFMYSADLSLVTVKGIFVKTHQ